MDEKRHAESGDQLEERNRAGRVEVFAIDAGVDHDSLEAELRDRSLSLLQELVSFERDGGSQSEQPARVATRHLGRELVVAPHRLDRRVLLRYADPVVAENGNI